MFRAINTQTLFCIFVNIKFALIGDWSLLYSLKLPQFCFAFFFSIGVEQIPPTPDSFNTPVVKPGKKWHRKKLQSKRDSTIRSNFSLLTVLFPLGNLGPENQEKRQIDFFES